MSWEGKHKFERVVLDQKWVLNLVLYGTVLLNLLCGTRESFKKNISCVVRAVNCDVFQPRTRTEPLSDKVKVKVYNYLNLGKELNMLG